MRTPAGKECKYFYADYHRGHNTEICRLVEQNADSEPWNPRICESCPVPDILRANPSDTLKLEITITKKWFGFREAVKVEGWCSNCFSVVPDPAHGCPNCNNDRPSILDLPEMPR